MSDEEFALKMQEGLQLTYRRLVEQKRRTGNKLILGKDGKIIYVDPFDLEI